MKQSVLIILFYWTFTMQAQCAFLPMEAESFSSFQSRPFVQFCTSNFVPEQDGNDFFQRNECMKSYLQFHNIDSPELKVPNPPTLTTKSGHLEVCEGNTTTLTAVSEYPIEWYTNYPPEGEPVGRGNVFVTPSLTQGYFIYHAVANNQGIKSTSSEMEVVMVYPLPFINIVKSKGNICSGETATLSAFGTRYYFWDTGETTNEISIQPNQTTHYQVTGMNTAGCKHSIGLTQVVENCELSSAFFSQSVLAESKKPSLPNKSFTSYIYPNPNTGEFHVQLSSVSEFTRLEVYSAFGELVYADKTTQIKTTLNLSHVNKGIYTLRILEQNTLLSQQKIVIEN